MAKSLPVGPLGQHRLLHVSIHESELQTISAPRPNAVYMPDSGSACLMAHVSSVRRVINERPDAGGPHTVTRRGATAAHVVAEEPQASRDPPLKDTTQAGGMFSLVPGTDNGDSAMNVHELVRLILMVSTNNKGQPHNDLFSDQLLFVSARTRMTVFLTSTMSSRVTIPTAPC